MTSRNDGPESAATEPGQEVQSEKNTTSLPRIGEGSIEGDRPVLIPEGVYELAFRFHETAVMFNEKRPKVLCHFEVVTQGKHFGSRLTRYYNASKVRGNRGKGGLFTVGWRSDFVRDYASCFGLPANLKRISTEPYSRVLIRGKVKTVSKSSSNKRLPDAAQYSVISEILGIVQ